MPNRKNIVLTISGTPAAQRRERPLVVMNINRDSRPIPRIVELARERGWQPMDLVFYDRYIPSGIRPRGAFVDCLPTNPYVRQLRRRGCHVVRLGQLPHPRDTAIPVVMEDLAAAGRLAAEHFAERRFRHVGFVGYEPLSENRDMYEGLREQAGKLGCECHLLAFRQLVGKEDALPREERVRLRSREFAEWIARVPKPIGVLTINDVLAGRLCALTLKAGFAIPSEVAVLGHGDEVAICESAPVALSSIAIGSNLAEAAVRVMQDLLAGKPGPVRAVLVPPRGITLRASTDVLASADPGVAAALRYMWDHLDMNLSVDDVAGAAGINRRHLERSFRAHLGRGVNAELGRKRLEVFRGLLISTDQPIAQLAPAVGFRTLAHLQRSFARAYGMSPREYRKNVGCRAPGPDRHLRA